MKTQNNNQPIGTLRISRDVLASIAGIAAREVEGVRGLAPLPIDLKGILTRRQIPRPVSVTLTDDIAVVDLNVVLTDGARIPIVADRIQTAVKDSIQSMTGITVSKVNVIVAGIEFASAAR